MTTAAKIGEPIPLGIVERESAILGSDDAATETPHNDAHANGTAEQLAALREEILALKDKIAAAGNTAVKTVGAHPFLTATVLSLGIWALIGMAYRRSNDGVADVYPALKKQYDKWS